jgi:two-component system chemotaxis response regulator CheB
VNIQLDELMADRIKLLVVDDSEFMRRAIRRVFETSEQLQVVGEACNGVEALESLHRLQPDVVTLDVHMPVMDGVSTLKRIMIQDPKPTVMLSNLTLEGAKVTFDTLKYGAVDFIPKPSNMGDLDAHDQQRDIIHRIELAARVQIESVRYLRTRTAVPPPTPPNGHPCRHLVAMGAGEGGYGALLKIIPQLKADTPAAFLGVIYADAPYVDAFVDYLNHCSAVHVKRAVDGDRITAGVCYLASGREYLTVQGTPDQPKLLVNPAPFENHKGAINMMMISVAECFAQQAVALILTGSGTDGVEGIGEVLRYGGRIMVQSPGSCLHKEMVQSVLNRHRVSDVVTDGVIATAVNEIFA